MLRYAGQGRTTLVCLKQDIEDQVATGKLLTPEEYLTWAEYFRGLAEEMDREYQMVTGAPGRGCTQPQGVPV